MLSPVKQVLLELREDCLEFFQGSFCRHLLFSSWLCNCALKKGVKFREHVTGSRASVALCEVVGEKRRFESSDVDILRGSLSSRVLLDQLMYCSQGVRFHRFQIR